jgi:anthranilate synthase component 2
MKIAIIDNYDSFVYNLVRYVQEADGVSICKVMRNDSVDYSYLETADAILLSPGPGVPSEAGELLKVIASYAKRKPILGVCLGHQALGEYYNGTLEKAPTILHGKSTEIHLDTSSQLFAGLNEKESVGRYHSWQVSKYLPDCLEQIAFDDQGQVMAFQHAELPIYGVQFHPESILTPSGRVMINNWILLCKQH